MQTLDLIKSDLYRYYGSVHFTVFLKAIFLIRGFNYMFWFRLASSGVPIVSQFSTFWLRLKQQRYGIHILKGTEIGPGLYIGHGGPCIVHPTARIGRNANLSQFVTIGSNHRKAASIGDNVYIGPNAILVEDIMIGNNVTIGAGAIVTRSVPDNWTVAGNPARQLNQNAPGRYCINRWPEKRKDQN